LEERERFPKAAEALCSSFYVDDFLGGCSTPEEAIELREQLSSLLSNGGFPLRKWCSNNTAVLESILPEERETVLPCSLVDEGFNETLRHRVASVV
jgi:hypothetical protein